MARASGGAFACCSWRGQHGKAGEERLVRGRSGGTAMLCICATHHDSKMSSWVVNGESDLRVFLAFLRAPGADVCR